jgi:5'(3')-deoxyribonucleotidase
MKGSRRFVLGVDLDGCVADFYGGIRPIAAEWLGVDARTLTPNAAYNLPEWKLDELGGYNELHRFAVTQRELFRKLEPIPGAAPALRRLSVRDVRIRIITHRLFIKHFHEEAVTQTTAWLDHHGIPYWDLCFMREKGAVGADLYIEDAPGNVQALLDDDLDTICFTNSTNKHLDVRQRADCWQEVERMVVGKLGEWAASGQHSRSGS